MGLTTKKNSKPVCIHMADDDEDYCMLVREALEELNVPHTLSFSVDGEALIEHLDVSSQNQVPFPGLILLDLNMPKKNGFDALKEIRSNQKTCAIPVVMMTISNNPKDITESYRLGANSFLTKSLSFDELTKSLKLMIDYWFNLVRIP